ncbi:MAG TPA: hypothetical protein VML75_12060 [Kofleriaceae bacterium]|nr:hypothetical protein [Kofleriaceae bacterium]
MATGGSRGGGGSRTQAGGVARPGVGARAIDAALAAPAPFSSRAMSMTQRSSSRVVDRWAPEDGAHRRSRGLGSLAFADRLLTSYVQSSGGEGPELSFRTPSLAPRMFRTPPMTSWLFPVPWYQDELAWVEAARQTQLSQAGQWGGDQWGGDQWTSPAARTASVPAAELLARSAPALASLPFVAPTLRASHAAGAAVPSFAGPTGIRVTTGAAPTGAPVRGVIVGQNHRRASHAAAPLRAWSPLVSFRAAQAAEVMASALANTPDAEAASEGGLRSLPSPIMELIAPRDLADAGQPTRSGGSTQALPAPQSGTPQPRLATASSRSVAAQQRIETALRQVAAAAAPPASVASPGPPAPPMQPTSVQALLAAAAAAPVPGIAPAGGPRVAMPAGLGGFVVGTQAANVVARPLAAAMPQATGALPPTSARPTVDGQAATMPRGAALAPRAIYASSALEAIGESRPAALDHVAWSDRWLARFAGASPIQLASLALASETAGPLSFTELVAAAPMPVFLSPAETMARRGPAAPSAQPGFTGSPIAPPAMTVISATEPRRADGARAVPLAPRIADDAAVPASVFEAIARTTVPSRSSRTAGRPTPAVITRPEPIVFQPAQPTPSVVDQVLSAPPIYTGAGLHAGLASSPIAPALAGVLDLPAAPLFDVRATAPVGMAQAYLTGGVRPIAVRPGGQMVAAAAQREGAWQPRILGPLAVLGGALVPLPPGVEPHHPRLLQALLARAPEATFVTPFSLGVEPSGAVGASSAAASGPGSSPGADAASIAAAPAASAVRSEVGGVSPGAAIAVVDFAAAMRPAASAGGSIMSGAEAPSRAMARQWTARPGSTAQMVQAFSVEQEHASGDLSFDFVPPEVVLAARQYGFGPAEAVAAVHLAAGGASRLAAMASAMDFAFVQAFSGAESMAQAEPRRMAAGAESYGYAMPSTAAAPSRGAAFAGGSADIGDASGSFESAGIGGGAGVADGSRGAPRANRLPRGAFLWPASSAEAMRLSASGASAEHPMAMAALDLLAAQVVVEAGRHEAGAGLATGGGWDPSAAPGVAATPREAGALARALTGRPGSAPLPPEFESIYVALAASSEGRAMPVAARAARALALAEQASAGTPGASARARAAAAWAVMPMVLNGAPESGAASVRGAGLDGSDPTWAASERELEARPVLRRSGAGDSLRALVAPQDAPAQLSASQPGPAAEDSAPARRAVRRDVVQTGASPQVVEAQARAIVARARASGAQPDLPDWFESAARRMMEENQGSDGMSLAEMTLVTAAPARHIAASTRSADSSPAASMNATSPSQGSDGAKESPDVEALAQEIFAEVCRMFEIVKERNGDPWLS